MPDRGQLDLLPRTPESARNLARRRSVLTCLAVTVGAGLFVLGVDCFTNVMPPRWDAVTYVRLAEHGWTEEAALVAPFAYRPGMPALAAAWSRAFGTPMETAFPAVGRLAMIALLVLAFALARRITGRDGPAALVALLVGLSAAHVKFPLFFPTLVDVAAYPILVLAFLFLHAGRPGPAFFVSWIGLLFKEFLVIPLVLALRVQLAQGRRAWAAIGIGLALLITILPRVLVPVTGSFQEIDPFRDPSSLRALYLRPLDLRLDVNVAYVFLGYWLPTLLLLTPDRVRDAWRALEAERGLLALTLVLVFLLTLYGGTNLFAFASYAVAAQILVLAAILRVRVPRLEILAVLLAVAVYNRIFWPIPLPDPSFDAYIDFYGGWADRFGWKSFWRVVECAGYLAVVNGGRWISRRMSRPAAGLSSV